MLRLLKENDAPAWYQDELGWTAMHYAAEREDQEMVKAILKNGGVWNAGELDSRPTPAHLS